MPCRGTHHDLISPLTGEKLGEYHENPLNPQWRIVIVDEFGAEAFHNHSRETALRDLRELLQGRSARALSAVSTALIKGGD
jgi:hypothetical protein